MKLLVCGSRKWTGHMMDIARELRDLPRGTVIIHGACSRRVDDLEVSVDMLADLVADRCGFPREPYPVDHALDGPWPGAGPRRNARMLAEGRPDRGLAFGALWRNDPGEWMRRGARIRKTGTGDMVHRMLAARLPVRWIATAGAEAVDLTEMPPPTGETR